MSEETVEAVTRVEIFEPPMCCPTGLCGPVQDPTLLDLLETVRTLESDGARVARYQPLGNPAAFALGRMGARSITESVEIVGTPTRPWTFCPTLRSRTGTTRFEALAGAPSEPLFERLVGGVGESPRTAPSNTHNLSSSSPTQYKESIR